MKLPVKDSSGNSAGELDVKFEMIMNGRATQAVHDYVVAYNANQRMGTACTKNVGDVNGTNKKPWRQKGTGRARAGSFASPLWRGGGVVFGPKPRDFSKKVNRKTKQLALRKALSERLKAGEVSIVSDLNLAVPKTKEFLKVIAALKLAGTTVIVTSGKDATNLYLASRNVRGISITTGELLNTYDVLLAKNLVFTREGFAQVEQRLESDQP
ncbi:MAG: 50S ribosomal protein L4 [Verrucomicrobia bacterium]|nr:50S ribosomal protein L4 [Verrucomicrobiota bacterium]